MQPWKELRSRADPTWICSITYVLVCNAWTLYDVYRMPAEQCRDPAPPEEEQLSEGSANASRADGIASEPADNTDIPNHPPCSDTGTVLVDDTLPDVPPDNPSSSTDYHPRVCTPERFAAWRKSHQWLKCYEAGLIIDVLFFVQVLWIRWCICEWLWW